MIYETARIFDERISTHAVTIAKARNKLTPQIVYN
jgi:hypothetical protein